MPRIVLVAIDALAVSVQAMLKAGPLSPGQTTVVMKSVEMLTGMDQPVVMSNNSGFMSGQLTGMDSLSNSLALMTKSVVDVLSLRT